MHKLQNIFWHGTTVWSVTTFIKNAVPQQITKHWESWHSLYVSLICKESTVQTQETSKRGVTKNVSSLSATFLVSTTSPLPLHSSCAEYTAVCKCLLMCTKRHKIKLNDRTSQKLESWQRWERERERERFHTWSNKLDWDVFISDVMLLPNKCTKQIKLYETRLY